MAMNFEGKKTRKNFKQSLIFSMFSYILQQSKNPLMTGIFEWLISEYRNNLLPNSKIKIISQTRILLKEIYK